MTTNLPLGRHDVVAILPSTTTHRVTTGTRHLDALEDGQVRYWSEVHVFMVNHDTGHVVVDGTYGTFAHAWPEDHRGKGVSLARHLMRMDFDQFMRKASTRPHMEADLEATLAEMRKDMLRDRRDGDLDKERARLLWDLLRYDLEDAEDERSFIEAVYADRDLYEHYCDGDQPCIRRREVPVLRRFWDEVWEAFRNQVLWPMVEAEAATRSEAA